METALSFGHEQRRLLDDVIPFTDSQPVSIELPRTMVLKGLDLTFEIAYDITQSGGGNTIIRPENLWELIDTISIVATGQRRTEELVRMKPRHLLHRMSYLEGQAIVFAGIPNQLGNGNETGVARGTVRIYFVQPRVPAGDALLTALITQMYSRLTLSVQFAPKTGIIDPSSTGVTAVNSVTGQIRITPVELLDIEPHGQNFLVYKQAFQSRPVLANDPRFPVRLDVGNIIPEIWLFTTVDGNRANGVMNGNIALETRQATPFKMNWFDLRDSNRLEYLLGPTVPAGVHFIDPLRNAEWDAAYDTREMPGSGTDLFLYSDVLTGVPVPQLEVVQMQILETF